MQIYSFCLPSAWKPASMMASTDPCLIVFTSLKQQSLHQLSRAELVGCHGMMVWRLLKLGHRRNWGIRLEPCHSPWGDPATTLWGHSSSPERGPCHEEWMVCTNWPATCVSHLGKGPSSLSQTFRWLQPWPMSWLLLREFLSQNQLAKLLLNSNPPKLCAIINVYCCSKLLNLELIYYAAIDNIINLITQVHKENFLETFTITIKENDNH